MQAVFYLCWTDTNAQIHLASGQKGATMHKLHTHTNFSFGSCRLQELLSTVGQLSELLHGRYPTAVPSSFVWGYGRPLWDVSSRAHGLKPLRVVLLGPAASGKSTQCAVLASR